MRESGQSRRINLIILIILIVLNGETIALSIINRDLHSKLHFYEKYLARRADNTFLPGTDISNLELKGLDDLIPTTMGNIVHGRGGLVFIFSSDCFSCDEVAVIWSKFAGEYRGTMPIIGVSINDQNETENYRQRNHIEFPIYRLITNSEIREFRITPNTVLLSKQGAIIRAIAGVDRDMHRILD